MGVGESPGSRATSRAGAQHGGRCPNTHACPSQALPFRDAVERNSPSSVSRRSAFGRSGSARSGQHFSAHGSQAAAAGWASPAWWAGLVPAPHRPLPPGPDCCGRRSGRKPDDTVGERHLAATLLAVRRWMTGWVGKSEDRAHFSSLADPVGALRSRSLESLGHAAFAATTSTWRVVSGR